MNDQDTNSPDTTPTPRPKIDYDDKDLAIVAISVITIAGMIASSLGADITTIFTHALTALGSLAIGRKL